MDLARIRELLKLVAESSVAEMELEEDGVKLVVRKNAATVMVQPPPMAMPYGASYPPPYPPMPPAYAPPQAAPLPAAVPAPAAPVAAPAAAPAPATTLEQPAPAEAPAEAEGVVVRAPIVGTYYEAPAPDADPFVQVGDLVKPGDVLCIIEAMKLMNEIECELAGTVRKIFGKNAEPVEYDQPLFLIDPA